MTRRDDHHRPSSCGLCGGDGWRRAEGDLAHAPHCIGGDGCRCRPAVVPCGCSAGRQHEPVMHRRFGGPPRRPPEPAEPTLFGKEAASP